nr:MAG TPA: Protein of unknown function (DUF551) [Caudoviricetes sp.]
MSHIKDRLIQLKNEVESTGDGAYLSKNNISKIVELLLADLEQDEKENGWIPVSEGLPEVSGTYQVTCMDGRIYRSTYAKFQCKLKRWELTGARSYWKVTAWMPLSEPYKED